MSTTIKVWTGDTSGERFNVARRYEGVDLPHGKPATLIIGDEPVFMKEDLTSMVMAMIGVVKVGGIAVLLAKDADQESEWMKHLHALRAEIKKHGITLP